MSTGPPERRRWTVDRREGELFVVVEETGRTLELPAWMLPAATREGDSLELIEAPADPDVRRWTIRRDDAATDAAGEQARELIRRLASRDAGGDVTL
jgi:hypothetical protein